MPLAVVVQFKYEVPGNVQRSTVRGRAPGGYGHLVGDFDAFDEGAGVEIVREGHGVGSPT